MYRFPKNDITEGALMQFVVLVMRNFVPDRIN